MARHADSRPLDTGDTFPSLELSLVDGSTVTLPSALSKPFNVVLVNRGSWCPYCVTQLKSFQLGLAKLEAEGIGVVSLSSDPLDKAKAMVAEHGLTFPVAHSANIEAVSRAIGGYYDPGYLQSASFVLGPEGKVLNALYSSGAIGRVSWQDVVGMVQYIKSKG